MTDLTEPEIKSCQEALEVLASFLDGELEDGTGAQVEKHLATCKSCYSRAEFERRLKARMTHSARDEVGAELRQRVRHLIDRFAVADLNDPPD